MVVGLAVVADRPPLQRVGDRRQRYAVLRPGGLPRQLERVQRRPRVALRPAGRVLERVGVDSRRIPDLAPRDRAVEQHPHVLGRQGLQLVDAATRKQCRVDLEVRVLGRRPDQRDQSVLDRGQQRVLLGLVEAVDLVQEEDRRGAGQLPTLSRPLDHRPDLRPPGLHRALLLERGAGGPRDDPCQRRLAAPRRPVQDHRVRMPGLDRPAQRRALGQQVALADELLEGRGAHPGRERRIRDALPGWWESLPTHPTPSRPTSRTGPLRGNRVVTEQRLHLHKYVPGDGGDRIALPACRAERQSPADARAAGADVHDRAG